MSASSQKLDADLLTPNLLYLSLPSHTVTVDPRRLVFKAFSSSSHAVAKTFIPQRNKAIESNLYLLDTHLRSD